MTRWRGRLAAATWSVLDVGRADPLDDQVFVVLTGEGLVMKRLRRRDDPWELKSDNPAHESRAVTARTESSVRARGGISTTSWAT